MAEKILTIGAGHGFNTPGKRCLKSLDKNETREWVLNNRVVNYVMEGLKVYDGLRVIRLDDPTGQRDVPLKERTNKANKANADLLLSIHHNAGINGGSGGGVVVYRYPNSTMTTKAMQKSLYDKIVAKNKLKGNRANPLPEAKFHMLRESKMPALLVENGFMDSKTDVPIILTDAHARKTAEGIVEFVVEHFKLKKKPVPQPPSDGETLYRVQVGAFKNKEYADNMYNKLKADGYDTYMVIADGFYKVQTGAFKNRQNADNLANKLKKAGYDVYITTKAGSPASATKPEPQQGIKVGDKVRVKKGAKTYTGGNLASFVYNTVYDVLQVNGDRVVIGLGKAVTAAMHVNDLIKQ